MTADDEIREMWKEHQDKGFLERILDEFDTFDEYVENDVTIPYLLGDLDELMQIQIRVLKSRELVKETILKWYKEES